MSYIILEIQTYDNGQTALVPPLVYYDAVEAEAVFLEKSAAACRSTVAVHTIVRMTSGGQVLERKVFQHQATT